MKIFVCLPFCFCFCFCFATATAQLRNSPNVFIITTDGLRWQEVFDGADDRILSNPDFVEDSALTKDLYGGNGSEEKRKKLMPFLWSTVARSGQLHGNRHLGNQVNVSNLYKISYPGYNEMLTGYADPLIMKNKARANENENLLEFLNRQDAYKGSVVAFSSWNVFPAIFNEQRSNILVNSGYENMDEPGPFAIINSVQDSLVNKSGTRHDQLTFINAREYIALHHPKVMFLGLGETDEFGHQKKYDRYLQQANNVDKMLAELWYFVQTDSMYRNNTIFIITTDHGRGRRPAKWYSHSTLRVGSGETWLAMIGPGIRPLGEVNFASQIYQKQIAASIARMLDLDFVANHPVAGPINLPVYEMETAGSNYTNAGAAQPTFSAAPAQTLE